MISVIIPVYNVEPYLRNCLDSVIAQTYTGLEIIIVDDGSTDSSGSICDEYAAKDARIQVVHQENQGLSAARNKGIDLSSGEYITFVDSDDLLLPDMLEKLLNLSLQHAADISICGQKTINNESSPPQHLVSTSFSWNPDISSVYNGREIMEAYLRGNTISNTVWAKLYTAELFREIRFEVGRLYEDVFITYQLLHAASRVALIHDAAYVYRKRPNSITTGSFTLRHSDCLYGRMEEMKFIQSHYPDLVPEMELSLINAAAYTAGKLSCSNLRSRETERLLQTIIRKHALSAMKLSKSRKIKLFLPPACIHIKPAMFLAKCYFRLSGFFSH